MFVSRSRYCQRKISRPPLHRWKSSVNFEPNAVPEYTIEEIRVPLPNKNYLAGKLWKAINTGHGDAAVVSQKNHLSLPPIICTHAWLDNASSFDPLLERILRPGMTAFAYDLPGHGYSSHTSNSDYDILMDGYTAITRIKKFFNWEKVVLLGHSAGSVISFVYSSVFPDSVHSYIALDNLCPLPSPNVVKELRRVTDSILKVEEKLQQRLWPLAYSYEDILQKLYLGRENTVTLEGCKILLRRGAVQRPDGKYSFSHDLRANIPTWRGRFHEETVRQMCSELTCPMCMIKA